MNSQDLAILSFLVSWISSLASLILPDLSDADAVRRFLVGRVGPMLANLADVTATKIDNSLVALVRRSWDDDASWAHWLALIQGGDTAAVYASPVDYDHLAAIQAGILRDADDATKAAIDPATIAAFVTAILQILAKLWTKQAA